MQKCPKVIRKFKKRDDLLHIGSKLKILELIQGNKYKINAEIIEMQDKGLYNMYLCKNLKTGCKISFTDMDIGRALRVKNGKDLIIEVIYNEG